jgi:hypothetical protein
LHGVPVQGVLSFVSFIFLFQFFLGLFYVIYPTLVQEQRIHFFLTLSAFLLSMSIASFCFHFFSGYGLGFPRLGGVGVGKGNA